MRKTVVLLLMLGFVIASCKKEVKKDYISLHGTIQNGKTGELFIKSMDDKVLKEIKLKEDGTFSDTLKLPKGFYLMDYDKKYFKLFLYPGAELNVTADNNDFEETLKFEGEASKENNYTLYRLTQIKKLLDQTDDLYIKEEGEFKQAMDKIKTDFEKMSLERAAGFDSLYLDDEKRDNAGLFEYLKRYYSIKHEMLKMKGKPSPEFVNYENAAGGKSSLKDFRGKYVYIDNWATWCRPCIGEIPYLKELEKKYGDKIHFISISLDRENDYDTWKKMVKEENLTGVQLFAHGDNSFADAYKIISIPRFIIIDPEGNVYDPDAPRPSAKNIDALLAELVGK